MSSRTLPSTHNLEERRNISASIDRVYSNFKGLRDLSPYLVTRLSAFFNLRDVIATTNWCRNHMDLFDSKLNYITHTSTSHSDVFTATLRSTHAPPTHVFGKVSAEYCGDGMRKDDSLWTESQIYRYVNTLLLRRATPHVVTFVGEFTCGYIDAQNILPEPNWRRLTSKSAKCLRVLLTEGYPNTITLHQFLKTADDQAVKDVFFQVLWTMLVFMDVGLEHHDLQFNNILVSTLPHETTNVYKISNSMIFKITTRYFVRIFDFDHSTKWPTKDDDVKITNPKMCHGYGDFHFQVGKKPRPNYDLFKFLGSLRRSGKYTLFRLPDRVLKELEKPRSHLFNDKNNPVNPEALKLVDTVELGLLLLNVGKLSTNGAGEKWRLPSITTEPPPMKRKRNYILLFIAAVSPHIHTYIHTQHTLSTHFFNISTMLLRFFLCFCVAGACGATRSTAF